MSDYTLQDNESEDIVRGLPTALLGWYDFTEGADALYIGERDDAVADMLRDDRGLSLDIIGVDELMRRAMEAAAESETETTDSSAVADDIRSGYDYIICIAALELTPAPAAVLDLFSKELKDDGVLLIGMNNRFGIRYFCGDRDIYTERSFDGVEGYWRAYNKEEDIFRGRMYSRAELERMLADTGFTHNRFYSVFPDLREATFIQAEGYAPDADMATRVLPIYNSPNTLFLDEIPMYRSLISDGLFDTMANAYLIECSPCGKLADVINVTGTLEQGRANAFYTIIHGDDTVTIRAAYTDGAERVTDIIGYMNRLEDSGLRVMDAAISGDELEMPHLHAPSGQRYLRELLYKDKDAFLEAFDHFRNLILRSSEIHEGVYEYEPNPDPKAEKSLTRQRHMDGYDTPTRLMDAAMYDMVPINSYYVDGEFVFRDQRTCIRNYPVGAMLLHVITSFYTGDSGLQKLLPAEELYRRYAIFDDLKRWQGVEGAFRYRHFDNREFAEYRRNICPNGEIINANRQRMNYPADEYQRLFVDIFEYADTRKLILFGSGLFAKQFAQLYAEDYPIYAIIDNNESRWGTEPEWMPGMKIQSPELLRTLRHGEYKILICIKNYLSVMNQLDDMGIREYSIYDTGKAYPRQRHPLSRESIEAFEHSTVPENGKKYHIGYIAGVFDLYHIGHLNMFRRAKEMCDYLIVGVVSEEGVRRFKGVDPFVPFEERIEMVRSCRYVDEAVEIPLMFGSTETAWELHHFDVQFSGSDYIDDPGWDMSRKFLEEHGATMEFFPYTQSTSSTKLKALIEKKLV